MSIDRALRSNSIIRTTYNPSGEKVYTAFTMEELTENEAKCQMEIKRFLNDYSLDLL